MDRPRWNVETRSDDVARLRFASHGLSTRPFAAPADVVSWLGAVQSQEYALATMAIVQRCAPPTADDAGSTAGLDDPHGAAAVTAGAASRAIAEGTLLRTHVLRPTWHFVHRDDIRWLLDLTAPRVQAAAQYRHRQLGITAALAARSIAVLASALEGGRHLTRRELGAELERSGIVTAGQRLAHLVMHAELEAVICSGMPRGRQQTYALLSERAPDSTWLPRDEALAELTSRYFRSHGPATVRDFQWWSSLSAADIRRGIEIVGHELEEVQIDGVTYWCGQPMERVSAAAPAVQLIHEFDEYLVGYSESRGAGDVAGLLPRAESLSRVVIVDGQVAGRWRRRADSSAVDVELLRPLARHERLALDDAVHELARAHA